MNASVVTDGLLGFGLVTGGLSPNAPTPTPTPTASGDNPNPYWFKSRTTISVPSMAATSILSGNPGRLLSVLVTTTGTGTGGVIFYDSNSTGTGTIIGYVPANATIGKTYLFDMPTSLGVVVVQVASGPVLTVACY